MLGKIVVGSLVERTKSSRRKGRKQRERKTKTEKRSRRDATLVAVGKTTAENERHKTVRRHKIVNPVEGGRKGDNSK